MKKQNEVITEHYELLSDVLSKAFRVFTASPVASGVGGNPGPGPGTAPLRVPRDEQLTSPLFVFRWPHDAFQIDRGGS